MTSERIDRQAVKTIALWAALLLATILCLAGLTRANVHFAEANPGGSDFLVVWEGMRSVIQGESPYDDATALRIQRRFYGRPALPGENALRVPYPIYALLFLAPLYFTFDFSLARGIWMTVSELATVGFALASLRLSARNWTRGQTAAVVVFALLWYFGARAIINGNIVILVALSLALALLLAEGKREWAAGAALAFSTVKPQVAIFPVVVCLLWWAAERRFRPILSFAGVMLAFMGIGCLLSPTWLSDEWREVVRYSGYDAPGNPASSLRPIFGSVGVGIGILVSILALLLMAIFFVRMYRAGGIRPMDALLLTLALAPLSGMQTDAGNQYILLLPLICFLIPCGKEPVSSGIRFAAILALVGIGLWALFLLTIQWTDQPVQNPAMLFPLPVFLLGVWAWDRYRRRGTVRPIP
jgi:hypothetical protein